MCFWLFCLLLFLCPIVQMTDGGFAIKFTIISKDRDPRSDNSWSNLFNISYTEGELLYYTCSQGSSYAADNIVTVIHEKGKYEIMKIERQKLKVTLSLWLTLFDDDTNIVCKIFNRSGNLLGEKLRHFSWDSIHSSDGLLYVEEMVPENNTSCYGNYSVKRWLQIKDNAFDTKYSPIISKENSKLPLKLTRAQKGNNYVCLTYNNNNPSTDYYYRNMSRIVTVDSDRLSSEEYSDGSNGSIKGPKDLQIYLIAGSTIAVIVVGIIVWYACSSRWHKGNGGRGGQGLPEHIYDTPIVHYAELQMMSSPHSRPRPREEAPYAHIVGVMEPADKPSFIQ